MSNITSNTFTKKQILDCLQHDGIKASANTINRAKNDNGVAFHDIGILYYRKENYSKAIACYRLAANQNYAPVYVLLGDMYAKGEGVPQDYFKSMDWYIEGAKKNLTTAMDCIGQQFLEGLGVPVDKKLALEWFVRGGNKHEEISKLIASGVHVKEENKEKLMYHFISETEMLVSWAKNLKSMTDSSVEFFSGVLKEFEKQQQTDSSKKEKQRENSEESSPSKQSNNNSEQQLKDKLEIINSLNTTITSLNNLVQSKDNEIDSLKKINHLEKEELKRKIEELERGARVPIYSTDNNTITSNLENSDDITVKTEDTSEDSHSISCQLGNKKRKMSSNDA